MKAFEPSVYSITTSTPYKCAASLSSRDGARRLPSRVPKPTNETSILHLWVQTGPIRTSIPPADPINGLFLPQGSVTRSNCCRYRPFHTTQLETGLFGSANTASIARPGPRRHLHRNVRSYDEHEIAFLDRTNESP